MKKKHSESHGMRSATMPKEHFERKEPQLEGSNLKYATEFGNPEELDRDNRDLAGYMKKHRMKY